MFKININMLKRPYIHDEKIAQGYYSEMADHLIEQCPNFIHNMDKHKIMYALKKAGLPGQNQTYRYMKQLDASDWSGFTDDVLHVFTNAYGCLNNVLQLHTRLWIKKTDLKMDFIDGCKIKYVTDEGEIYKTKKLCELGQVMFRNEGWIKSHGNQGGIIINVEDITMLTTPS